MEAELIFKFSCQALNPRSGVKDLEFFFNSETGTVSGASENEISKRLSAGSVALHPFPHVHEFSGERPKLEDIAAIVGLRHALPPELEAAYPRRPEQDAPEAGDDGLIELQAIW